MVAILFSAWLVSLWLMTCKSGHFTILSLFGGCGTDAQPQETSKPSWDSHGPGKRCADAPSVFNFCGALVWCGQSLLGSLWPWLSHLHFKEGNTWTASAVTWDYSVAYLKGLCPSAQGSWGSTHKSCWSACPDLCFLSTTCHTVVIIKSLAHVHCITPVYKL